MLPLSWRPDESLQLHANLGWDWAGRTGARATRGGLGLEWAARPALSLLAERFRAQGQWTSRAGLRWNITPLMSVDLTAARAATGATGGPTVALVDGEPALLPGAARRARGVGLGFNHAFDWR